jgi:HK97 family phage portal protein
MFNWVKNLISKKSMSGGMMSEASILLGYDSSAMSPYKFATYARDGYCGNPYVYACINKIAKSAADIPTIVSQTDKRTGEKVEVMKSPFGERLTTPNPGMRYEDFIIETVSNLLLGGNNYWKIARPLNEVYNLRPDRVQIDVDIATSEPLRYRYTNYAGIEEIYQPEDIHHMKLYNPTDSLMGMAPLAAAALSADLNNEGRKWNYKLTKNGCQPPGSLTTESKLQQDQIDRLRAQFENRYQGAGNAGKPLVFEGGLKWQTISMSPSDMGWLEASKLTSREIAIVFGVPPELIGDSSNKTYSNYQEGRKAFYSETVVPLVNYIMASFNLFLAPAFNALPFSVEADLDQVEALQEDREKVWNMTIKAKLAGVITANEAREYMGYSKVEGDPEADILKISSSPTVTTEGKPVDGKTNGN